MPSPANGKATYNGTSDEASRNRDGNGRTELTCRQRSFFQMRPLVVDGDVDPRGGSGISNDGDEASKNEREGRPETSEVHHFARLPFGVESRGKASRIADDDGVALIQELGYMQGRGRG